MNRKQKSLIEIGIDQQTMDIPQKTVTLNTGAQSILSLFKVPLNSVMIVKAVIFAKGATGVKRAVYEITAVVKNIAGTTALVSTAVVNTFEDDATWNATLVANDTKDSIDLSVTPDTAVNTVFWGYASALPG